jgi:hypothetical protein
LPKIMTEKRTYILELLTVKLKTNTTVSFLYTSIQLYSIPAQSN